MPRLENADKYIHATTKVLLEKAREVNNREVELSTIFQAHAIEEIPCFKSLEICVGRLLGRGGFCVVREITAIRLEGSKKPRHHHRNNNSQQQSNGDDTHQASNSRSRVSAFSSHHSSTTIGSRNETSREFLARRVWSKSSKYVIKKLNPLLLEIDKVGFLKGMIDLTLELHFLASLDHTNIMGVRGVSAGDPFTEPGFFLILDQLEDTLSKRLNTWMQKRRRTKGITGFFVGGKRKVHSLLVDRLLVAHDIAEGMNYLHSRNIIFRDLKPDNIGFDSDDTLKIFDFGLAKELRESDRDEDGYYRMTAFTGSIRYMAPEVGLRRSYNLKADVYSWSMIMYYILSLEPPMGLYTPAMFMDKVFRKGYRPALKPKWPTSIVELMTKSWSQDIEERPTFQDIMLTIRREAQQLDPQLSGFLVDEVASSKSGRSRGSTRSW